MQTNAFIKLLLLHSSVCKTLHVTMHSFHGVFFLYTFTYFRLHSQTHTPLHYCCVLCCCAMFPHGVFPFPCNLFAIMCANATHFAACMHTASVFRTSHFVMRSSRKYAEPSFPFVGFAVYFSVLALRFVHPLFFLSFGMRSGRRLT